MYNCKSFCFVGENWIIKWAVKRALTAGIEGRIASLRPIIAGARVPIAGKRGWNGGWAPDFDRIVIV